MRKFMINVNGKTYEVEVEEVYNDIPSRPSAAIASVTSESAAASAVSQSQSAAAAQNAGLSRPDVSPQPDSPPQPRNAGSMGTLEILAPMPGNILDIRANVGESVKKGQVILILEAMKMENEIMAPQDGKISSIDVSKGSVVNSGDLLFTMD